MPSPIETILCPVDFSASSEEAARYAVMLAEAVGAAKLYFLHAHQRIVYPAPVIGGSYIDPDTLTAIEDHLRRQLTGLVGRHSAHKVEVEGELREGPPHPTIVDYAKEIGADMIVMSTHGRTGIGHLLLGSVAEKVVRTSPIPVCTVRVSE